MTRNKIFIMGLLLAFCSWPARAAGKAGTTGGQALEIEPSARAAAMGGAFTAVADDSFSIYYNPAGLACVRGYEVPFASNQRFAGARQDFAGLAYNMHDIRTSNIEELGTIAGAYTNLSTGDIEGRNALGQPTGAFSARETVLTLAYGKSLFDRKGPGRFSIGAAGKFFEENIAGGKYSSQAFDGGALWENDSRTFSLGLAVMNMGKPVAYVRDEFPLPLNVKVGTAVRVQNDLLVALDYNNPANGDAGFNLGGEYWIMRTIALRLGYDARSDLATGLTAGFGFSLKDLNVYYIYAQDLELDYAFIPSKDVEGMHLLSLVLKLGTE